MITQANRPEARSGIHKRSFICDECGREISNREDVLLMRPANALPEDSTVYELHAACRADFLANHEGTWNVYDLTSAAASWLLPVMVDGK